MKIIDRKSKPKIKVALGDVIILKSKKNGNKVYFLVVQDECSNFKGYTLLNLESSKIIRSVNTLTVEELFEKTLFMFNVYWELDKVLKSEDVKLHID